MTEGGSIVFTCQYTSIFLQSDQFLPVAWIGPQLPRSAHSIASSRDGLTYVGTLNISDVGTAEEGEYSCTVNADQGLSRCRWWLTVTSSSLASPGALCSTPSGGTLCVMCTSLVKVACLVTCLFGRNQNGSRGLRFSNYRWSPVRLVGWWICSLLLEGFSRQQQDRAPPKWGTAT